MTQTTVRALHLRGAARDVLECRAPEVHGLDAAQKVDVTGAVRYEVAGVDISKLS